jgi:hypothetical protein
MNEHEWYHDPEVTEKVVEDALYGILTGCWDTEDSALEGSQIKTFEQDGVLTYNKGLVITLPNGTEYQLTIVRSR